jgi:hypothetical protein
VTGNPPITPVMSAFRQSYVVRLMLSMDRPMPFIGGNVKSTYYKPTLLIRHFIGRSASQPTIRFSAEGEMVSSMSLYSLGPPVVASCMR